MILIPTLLLIISGVCEAIMDTLNFHYHTSIFTKFNPQFWNPELSWKNKYVDGSKIKKWAFKTVLVFTTDAWHLFKVLHTTTFVIGMFLTGYLGYSFLWVLVLVAIKKGIFELLMKLFNHGK
jgi:hypothetical protein